jgi:hypothetical protein
MNAPAARFNAVVVNAIGGARARPPPSYPQPSSAIAPHATTSVSSRRPPNP